MRDGVVLGRHRSREDVERDDAISSEQISVALQFAGDSWTSSLRGRKTEDVFPVAREQPLIPGQE